MLAQLRPWHLAALFVLFLAAGCGDQPTITEGTITFDPQPTSVDGKMLYITIVRDPSGAAEELQRVDQEIDGETPRVKYELSGEEPPEGDYIMRVHLDMDDNEEVNTGDYVSDDTPVFQGEYPETVDVVLTPLQ